MHKYFALICLFDIMVAVLWGDLEWPTLLGANLQTQRM